MQQDSVQLEQVKTLYESMGSLLAINLLVSICLVVGFWDVIAHERLLLWMGLMLAMITVRAAVFWHYRRGFDNSKLTRYRRFLLLGSLSAGLIWGAGGLLLFPANDFDYQLFLLMALFGMTGGSTFTLSLYLPAYFAYVPATLLPIAVKLFTVGGATHTALAVITLVFLAALTSFNLRLNRNFAQSLQLRFENLDLIEQLTVQKLEAERSNLAKSKFLAAASHDLRQPLYSLGLFTSVLEELVDERKARKVVGQMRQSLAALENLFNKLLDISQLDAGVVKVAKSDIALGELFATLALDFDGLAAEKGIAIKWPAEPIYVHSDPVLLEQILRNLVANAVRHTNHGSITVSCERRGEQVMIKVADTGPGIPADAQEHIFTEFYQLDNDERDREKGLGLGLSIVKRAATLLGHAVEVQSVHGKGSTFSVSLDAGSETRADVRRGSTAEPSPSPAFSPEVLVVVVDDERDVREGTRQLLELWGCSVVTAEDASAALALLAASDHAPTAIISDFRLRDETTGLSAIKTIQAEYAETIPALLITGDIEQDRLLEIDAADMAVLFKPVPPRKLRAFLTSAAEQQRTAQAG